MNNINDKFLLYEYIVGGIFVLISYIYIYFSQKNNDLTTKIWSKTPNEIKNHFRRDALLAALGFNIFYYIILCTNYNQYYIEKEIKDDLFILELASIWGLDTFIKKLFVNIKNNSLRTMTFFILFCSGLWSFLVIDFVKNFEEKTFNKKYYLKQIIKITLQIVAISVLSITYKINNLMFNEKKLDIKAKDIMIQLLLGISSIFMLRQCLLNDATIWMNNFYPDINLEEYKKKNKNSRFINLIFKSYYNISSLDNYKNYNKNTISKIIKEMLHTTLLNLVNDKYKNQKIS